MTYPHIASRRLPYDIDGTEIAMVSLPSSAEEFLRGPRLWLNSTEKQTLQNTKNLAVMAHTNNLSVGTGTYSEISGGQPKGIWFFLPTSTEITHISIPVGSVDSQNGVNTFGRARLEGSNNSTNGLDGDWETAVVGFTFSRREDSWRRTIDAVSFSKPVKVLRLRLSSTHAFDKYQLSAIHLYGLKADGEQPDDILFCDEHGNNLTELMDFGNRPEGTTEIRKFTMRNSSVDKIANNINLQLNDEDFLMSFNQEGPWTSVLDLASIAPNSVSSVLYIKNQLAPPLLALGPRYARIIASVGSWD